MLPCRWSTGIGTLLILLVWFDASARATTDFSVSTPIIRLPLYQKQYLKLHVGNPGKLLTLRLRWDLDDHYLYESPEGYSVTFGDGGNEVFYIGNAKLRMPIQYGYERSRRLDTSEGVTYHGVIGLGRNSFLWRHWSSYTISKYSLTLGGSTADWVDIRGKSDGGDQVVASNTTQESLFAYVHADASNQTLNDSSNILPLRVQLGEEFSYVPLHFYRLLKPVISGRKESTQKIRVQLYSNASETLLAAPAHSNRSFLTLWLSFSSSYITTSYGSSEGVVRMAETRADLPGTALTLGRFHVLDHFVFYEDLVTGVIQLHRVFTSFPSVADDAQAPQALLSLVALFVWVWWTFETHPMLYEWVFAAPQQALRSSAKRLGSIDTISKLVTPQPTEPPVVGRQADRKVLAALLLVTRVTCLLSAYTSIFGFQSVRFVERLTKLAYLPPTLAAWIYYSLIAYTVGIPLLVNQFFLLHHAYAGVQLVTIALLACTWINQLPDVNHAFFSLLINLSLSTLLTARVFTWLFWSLLVVLPHPPTGFKDQHKTKLLPTTAATRATANAGIGRSLIQLYWWVVLVPYGCAFIICLNVLPAIEYLFPMHPLRVALALLYLLCLCALSSFVQCAQLHLDIIEEATAELRDAMKQLLQRLKTMKKD